MESNLQKSPTLGHPADSSDAKYVSGLSTILVATIQEAKDRISQIEYIFCSQLFPKFQSLQKIYLEARQVAENDYKEKETDLLLQIEKLQCQKQQVLEENQLLKLEKAKLINMETQSCNRIKQLQIELKQKTVEVNEGKEVHQNLQKLLESKSSLLHSYKRTMEELEEKNTMSLKMLDGAKELQNKLLQVNQSKASMIAQKEVQLKEFEEKTKGFNSKLENMENKVKELQLGLRDKMEEVEKGKELQANLLKKNEFQSSEIMSSEQLLKKYEKENNLLTAKVENLMSCTDELQKELRTKTFEVEEQKKMQEQLLQQTNSFNSERIKRRQALEEFEEERKQLLDKQKSLEVEVDKLRQSLAKSTKESSEGIELHGKLLQQIDLKDSELLFEKRKNNHAFAAYKRLKSQYNYLLKQKVLTQETMLPQMEDDSKLVGHNQTPVTSRDIENNISKTCGIASDATKPVDEQEVLEHKNGLVSIGRTSPVSPSSSNIPIAPKCPSSIKFCPPAGAKRPISDWKDTRSHQSRVGPDPHDDFLDTPLENVRKKLRMVTKEDVPDIPKSGPINMNIDNSDDETEDMNADAGPELNVSPPKVGISGFKYVEPVRKKSERESLKGVECKQCKKFYDAVLPGEGKNSNSDKQHIRCEHHDGVSRHRYRYAPPLTPEGFWNIGFESEI